MWRFIVALAPCVSPAYILPLGWIFKVALLQSKWVNYFYCAELRVDFTMFQDHMVKNILILSKLTPTDKLAFVSLLFLSFPCCCSRTNTTDIFLQSRLLWVGLANLFSLLFLRAVLTEKFGLGALTRSSHVVEDILEITITGFAASQVFFLPPS